MHLNVSHPASCHVVHYVKHTSFITCSVYESEKTRVDQVSEKVHPSVVLVPSLTLDPYVELTFSRTNLL